MSSIAKNFHHSIRRNTSTTTSIRQRSNRFPGRNEGSSFTFLMLYIVFLISFISTHNVAYAESTKSPIAVAFVSAGRLRPLSNKQQSWTTGRTVVDLPATAFDSPPSEMSDFQRRMKKLITDKKKKKNLQSNKNAPKNLMRIDTLEEYKNVISGNREKLIVVRFYAPWCKACKAIAPAFYRLAITYPNILFMDVPVTPENANLHQGLGVTTLPFGHIYHPTGGLVEETKISKKHFARFAQVLKTYIDGKCEISDFEQEEEGAGEGFRTDETDHDDIFR